MADTIIPEQQPILGKIYDFPGLQVAKDKHALYESDKVSTLDVVQPSALVGIEIEVENIDSAVNTDYYWQYKEDGSLRNNGAEFASIPLRARQVEFALDYLGKALTEFNEPEFSNRTSVHVHLNVRDMTWDQIKVLVITYAMYERHFFHQAGTKRESSIFCVPLYKSHQLRHFINDPVTTVRSWHKYNSVNLGTILGSDSCTKFGTIEFRHLFGTVDTKFIVSWINQILCLRREVMYTSLPDLMEKLRRINTTSEYFADYKRIFGNYALPYTIMCKEDFESCITTTKRAVFSFELAKYGKVARNSTLRKFVEAAIALKVKPVGLAAGQLHGNVTITKEELALFKNMAEVKWNTITAQPTTANPVGNQIANTPVEW